MSRVLAVCRPASDAGFGERVRSVVAQDRWDLASPEGVASIESVLRQTYPMTTVAGQHGVWSGGLRQTIVLEVDRDGSASSGDTALGWTRDVLQLSGAAAYRAAVRILGDGQAAERAVEGAFRALRGPAESGLSVAEAGAAVEQDATRLARQARAAVAGGPDHPAASESAPQTALAETAIRMGPVRRSLRGSAVSCLLSEQREALELAILEDLRVNAIADRMRTTASIVHRHLADALLAVDAQVLPTAQATLARWREAERVWANSSPADPTRPSRASAVAHAWLDYQIASGGVSAKTTVLVTDSDRRFVTASAGAATTVGRPSVIGLQIDDITASYARHLVPELWTIFDANGGMAGEYDCDRPDQAPIRIPFRGVWGRPVPELQVGYLQPAVASAIG